MALSSFIINRLINLSAFIFVAYKLFQVRSLKYVYVCQDSLYGWPAVVNAR